MQTLSANLVLASASHNASGTTNFLDCYDCIIGGVDIVVDVTAITGTLPTMDIWVQAAHEASPTTYSNIRKFTRITATGRYQMTIKEGLQKKVRLSYTLGGTSPVFTFSVYYIKHQA